MEIELLEIKNFLIQSAPFDELPDDALNELVQNIEIRYFRAETPILTYGEEIDSLYVIRSGVVEIYRRNGKLYNRMSEGQLFGQMGLFMGNKVRFPTTAVEDTLTYCIPAVLFHRFCNDYEVFADFMEVEETQRLRQVVQASENNLIQSKVKTLITRPAVIVDQNTSITDTAMCMKEENVSAVLIADLLTTNLNEEENTDPFMGIITDRDLCTRVLAENIDPTTAISEVMSPSLYCLDANAYLYEAMMTMLRYNINHLPIMYKGEAIGILANSDLLRYESQNSLLIVNSIFQQNNVEDLAVIAEQVKDCFVRMVQEEANSHMVGSAMAVIGRSFKQRLAELAEEKLGEPPVPYCLLALGSMARDEQLIVTDQDNALILDESYDPTLHNDYFEQLCQFICDGLNACGYTYCTGDIMATNPEWRKTLSQWKETFVDWIDNPDPTKLLHSSIFFDLDGVYGRTKWADQLYSFVVQRARRNNVFLAALAHTAGLRTPPLGFFKNFVMEDDGRHHKSINLKRRGTAPLVDLIRVHALSIGSLAKNSFERLENIIEERILPRNQGRDLQDALELLSIVRIRHQANDILEEQEPDNNIEPEAMSDFERRNLKDAFLVLSNAQKFIKFRYPPRRKY
ncbi:MULTISPECIES: DUF294 nucleotidyltransferase-like domain-containing protein [Pasteurellaceae]|uniref:DUF294 nucleotidyltransferase-like domain-containing protein n=1 Tax=Pasteurella atlantica TaxID=2827233 RepID=A0AAW8CNF0_9PAST|nr:DUF294 nucleotidyltransferase-like domain-containing protein [Pasteurella atlantica]MBR0573509.1 cyclic nucleotide-binding/CBS domain-containing protein [Pasteurella atlantica]MDP8039510.1 DUF294 nucleotidyltransferase-like domain-containing protein [Pasteurella atlantica]MDP8041601.1 DUF294 nucleotidyltransferase-like domain-containing protein [Pasteurella atlantica]MDP8043738.1 DUF294 nucleotidyltransferase-like domain-containing protein [Pasteurella atlantica]MDP8045765.1 DUF294 nucleoti